MGASEEPLGFVRNALGGGLPRAQIDCPVRVPRPRPYLSAREAFMHLASPFDGV
jgi:hypothetical protein